ncbi:sigma-70 family RNA polymerase sigma factor [Vibrio sp. MEBiC08052]|uniref:sigma-70 family RNA polymerase sigma factor n=1 Tax=Vibrio sp. MEBiC08052 TaxID=1761910 RepID=UPI00074069EB|nr:sigma-70 family RNA polymerase sigma factor [Vibrio sp. MEBiC08052]KUI97007.1 hypothetical protein VRK_38620 [Vibrio sp. MEBiC08052]
MSESNKDTTDIVFLYSGWLRRIVKNFYLKYYAPGVEFNDFIQYGSLGLIESAKHFDQQASAKFTSFAYLRVKGTILNNIYKFSDSGSLLHWRYRLNQERLDSFQQEQPLTDLESYAELVIELAFSSYLDEEQENIFSEDISDDGYRLYQQDEALDMIREFIELLPYQQRKIMTLHYFQFVSFTDIAELMQVSKARVSQLHAKSILAMKQRLESENLYDF